MDEIINRWGSCPSGGFGCRCCSYIKEMAEELEIYNKACEKVKKEDVIKYGVKYCSCSSVQEKPLNG
jgi:hypothetical protein